MHNNPNLEPQKPLNAYQAFPKVGFSTNVLSHPTNGELPPGQVVAATEALARQFSHVEIELSEDVQSAVLDATPAEYDTLVEGVRAAAASHGATLSVHAAWFGPNTNLSSADEAERTASISLLKRAIDFAHDLGARPVAYHPGYHNGLPRDRLTELLTRSVEEVVTYADRLGVVPCIENMGEERPSYVVLSADEHVRLAERTGTRLALDVIHLRSLHADGDSFFAELEQIAPYVSDLHIADMKTRHHAHLPIGDGDFPLTRVLECLARHGYAGGAIVEEFVRNRPFSVFLDRAREYRDWLDAQAWAGRASALGEVLVQLDALADGVPCIVERGSTSYAVWRRGQEVHVFQNSCPHTGGRLDALEQGVVDETEHLICTMHGARFDFAGLCISGPCARQSLVSVPVVVRGSAVHLAAADRRASNA